MQKPEGKLTDAELEIMHVVWELDGGTVRQVYEILNQQRPLAYTTVMTMMNILEEKGHLTRRKEGRAYHYQPVRPKSQVISGMVDDFVGRVFEGSAAPLVVSLVKDKKISKKDLDEIARMIRETE
ncbi:MAG: BlaI/MecI/CopY family transcriptional regulator [Acidobacteriota bacterium]|jgi:predicted transcriptional regulator|nr:BlaI/MecI/CopY family transcriptional regulator [Acidobacteriota bacterium]